YPEESFGYLFYKPKDDVVFVARRGVFIEREMISKEDSGSKIDLEEIQESADEEPIVNTDTQQEVVTPVEPDDISLPIRRTSDRISKPPQFYYGFQIEEDKISDSTLSELDKPANHKEVMASLEAAKKLTENVFMAQPEGFENAKYPTSFKRTFMDLNTLLVARISASMRKSHSLDFLEAKMKNDIPRLQSVKDWLEKCFAMKDLGYATYILGIKIYKDRSKRLIGLSPDTYLDKKFKRFKMDKSKKGSLPLHHGIKISTDLCPKTDEEMNRMSRVPYALAVGSIMYVMTCTRPDVSFALNIVSRHQENPGEGYWIVVKNILKYLRNTKDRFLVYGGEEELRVTVQDPIEIFYDNESAFALTKEPKDHGKSKHIERKYHFIRSKIEEGHVILKDIQSKDNPTDPFTKALAKSRHDEHTMSIRLKDNIKF
ncbi:hypothetical protein Tco_1389044, partial [Tanacetum coccineum]